MAKPLSEQVVVITGASSGIGRAAALKFGQAGASVVLAARNEEALRAVAEEIRQAGGKAHIVVTDVTDPVQVQHLADEAVRVFGRIDTWVNDAAVSLYATVDQTTNDEAEQLIRTNVLGTMYGVKAALPYMKRQGGGTIINVGSVESNRALPYQSAYAASKHAVRGFTESLRMELERDRSNINVTLILPSGMNTPLFRHARSRIGTMPMPVPPAYPPELAADAILHAARHNVRDLYVGGAGWLFTVLQRLSPALTDRLLMTRNATFRLQESGRPDDGRDNLFGPMPGSGRVHGDFQHLTKPSMFTRLAELMPGWQRLSMASLAGLAAFLLLRRH